MLLTRNSARSFFLLRLDSKRHDIRKICG